MRKQTRNLTGIVVLVVVIGAWLLIWFNQRALLDWFKLRGYTPPATIAQLATQTTMTAEARHDFYVNHPTIDDQTVFNTECPGSGEQTIVLGCYHSNQEGIFIYSVSDPRLQGVEQVTAAHEMLHAAYDRLSSKERNYVDGLLEDYFKNDLHDPRILATMAAYKKTEPTAVVNEMHSVFGTEVADLPPALESYYKQYFTNRQTVVAFAVFYQAAFVTRQNQVAADDVQLKQLKTEFTADEADLQSRDNDLKNQRAQLEADQQANQIDAYNAGVPTYNAAVDAYNTELATTQQLITQYNQLVVARNAIAATEQQLQQALSSQPAAAAAQ